MWPSATPTPPVSARAARSAPAGPATAARRPTPTSGRPPIHPRRSTSRPARALVRVMFSPTSSAPSAPRTALVSISVGGNDAGFSDVMTTCVLQSDSACLARIATAKAYVDSTLPGLLDKVYSAISAKAPAAHVVVLGYPRFYKLGTTCLGLSATKRSAINGAADYLDSRPRQARRRPRLHLRRRTHHVHRPRDLLRQLLAAQPQPAEHRRVVPPDRGRPVGRLSAR
jgi:hypothetical protein